LGAESCQQCHSKGSAFFFGRVPAHSMVEGETTHRPMVEFMDLDANEVAHFADTFQFRSAMKTTLWVAVALVAAVVLVYALRAIGALCRRFSREGSA